MRLLLDTHAFLWWITNSDRLSPRAREVMAKEDNRLLFSAASAWEIAIKTQLGKLEVPELLDSFITDQLRQNTIEVLPIYLRHALHVASLPNLHRDPFDRLLIAQSHLDHLPILSADPQFEQYGVNVIW